MRPEQTKNTVDEPPLPEWQKRELDRRYKAYQENRVELYDWEEVHAYLRDSLRRNRAATRTRK